jgi:hypothetical protein
LRSHLADAQGLGLLAGGLAFSATTLLQGYLPPITLLILAMRSLASSSVKEPVI